MKLLIILIVFWSIVGNAQENSEIFKNEYTARNILKNIGVDKNYLDLKKVLKFKSVEYASEWNHTVKRFSNEWDFWKNLNFKLYRNEFKELMQVEFTQFELNTLNEIYQSNDYNVKKLNSLIRYSEFFKLYNDLILGRRYLFEIPEKRKKLISELYNYLGFKIIEVNLKERLSQFERLQTDTFKVFDYQTKEFAYIKSDEFKVFKQNTKDLLMILLAKSLTEFSDHELLIYKNKKNDLLNRRFNQLYVNYHYLFVLNNILSNELSLGLIKPEES
jgi:hypothetical protein